MKSSDKMKSPLNQKLRTTLDNFNSSNKSDGTFCLRMKNIETAAIFLKKVI